MYLIKGKIIILTVITLMILLFTSCDYRNDPSYNSSENSENDINKNSVSNPNRDDIINFTVLGKKTISISKDRIYGNHLDNIWRLSEIDDILNAIKGFWKTDQYIGFITPKAYGVNVFEEDLSKDFRDEWLEYYNERVKNAKSNIPNICFSIKEHYDGWGDIRATNKNYIYINGDYPIPISIILSIDMLVDNQPPYRDQTAVSYDFVAEYPVLYIKFFVGDHDENTQTVKYKPATLIITSDSRFYVLIDGAFYSLEKKTSDNGRYNRTEKFLDIFFDGNYGYMPIDAVNGVVNP